MCTRKEMEIYLNQIGPNDVPYEVVQNLREAHIHLHQYHDEKTRRGIAKSFVFNLINDRVPPLERANDQLGLASSLSRDPITCEIKCQKALDIKRMIYEEHKPEVKITHTL